MGESSRSITGSVKEEPTYTPYCLVDDYSPKPDFEGPQRNGKQIIHFLKSVFQFRFFHSPDYLLVSKQPAICHLIFAQEIISLTLAS